MCTVGQCGLRGCMTSDTPMASKPRPASCGRAALAEAGRASPATSEKPMPPRSKNWPPSRIRVLPPPRRRSSGPRCQESVANGVPSNAPSVSAICVLQAGQIGADSLYVVGRIGHRGLLYGLRANSRSGNLGFAQSCLVPCAFLLKRAAGREGPAVRCSICCDRCGCAGGDFRRPGAVRVTLASTLPAAPRFSRAGLSLCDSARDNRCPADTACRRTRSG